MDSVSFCTSRLSQNIKETFCFLAFLSAQEKTFVATFREICLVRKQSLGTTFFFVIDLKNLDCLEFLYLNVWKLWLNRCLPKQGCLVFFVFGNFFRLPSLPLKFFFVCFVFPYLTGSCFILCFAITKILFSDIFFIF